ncbi:MAG: HAMP domain-containing histidine kinase [Ruminococcaceae bacterium]|nr:HAMP domain-containing histidine kinase [Oscillospiraceae bacterium]
MKKEGLFNVFLKYLKEYRYIAVLFVLSLCICAVVFGLYGSELEAVFYSFGLCLAMFIIVGLARFVHYLKKYKERHNVLNNLMLTAGVLPAAETPIEEDYHEMILTLKQMLDNAITEKNSDLQESIEYYTTWVHQIKTPISVMQMILQTEDTEEHRELSSQLFRIEQYVEMVLNYIRLGGSSSDFVFKEYDIDGIIKQAVHKYAPQFIRKHIRLKYESVSIRVITDEKWFSFMLEQLLSNAVKYTEKGQVAISVTEDSVLKISDTGIGIAKEDLPRIFEKGFTGYNGREDKKSTGLGLYLCRLTADRLSHRIWVESEIGKGSVFSVDLRRYEFKGE